MVKISGGYAKIKKWVTDRLHTDHQVASSESASFKEVDIAVNEAYKQGADIILRIKALNTFVGIDAGKVTSGNYNVFLGNYAGHSNAGGTRNSFIGYSAGYNNTTGNYNNFLGYGAGFSNIGGGENNFLGYYAGYGNTIGYQNNFLGYYAGYGNINGIRNTFTGHSAGYSNSSGHRNTFTGFYAGYSNADGNYNNFLGYGTGFSNIGGHRNNFLGSYAGYYETGSDKLFIDNQARSNESDGRIKALIYGLFDALTANQLIRLNGILELTEIKNGSTQANAGAVIDEVWKTNGHATLPDNVLMIGV